MCTGTVKVAQIEMQWSRQPSGKMSFRKKEQFFIATILGILRGISQGTPVWLQNGRLGMLYSFWDGNLKKNFFQVVGHSNLVWKLINVFKARNIIPYARYGPTLY